MLFVNFNGNKNNLLVISCQYLHGICISTLSDPICVPWWQFHSPYIRFVFSIINVVVFVVKFWLIWNFSLHSTFPFPILIGASQFPLSSPAGFVNPIWYLSLSTLHIISIVSPLSLYFRQTWCWLKDNPIKNNDKYNNNNNAQW